jgi:intracellular sulfur oxidation DsrE/DsrF family protein
MKRLSLTLVPILFLLNIVLAQQKEHKIVFDFTKADTASFATLMRQCKNILIASPNAKLEIVCHGPGLDMITKNITTVQKEIEELHDRSDVTFAACEATMKRRGVDKSQLFPFVVTVSLANLEISSKQQEGWSYIKAGY